MAADSDSKGQKKITDISGRSLILAAGRKWTGNRINYDIFYVVRVELRDCWFRRVIGINGIQDAIKNEVEE